MTATAAETIDGVPTYKLFIDGEWVRSSRNTVVDYVNPSTGEIYARVQQAGAEEVERAIAAAYRARESWGGSLVSEREAVLFRAADILTQRMDEIRDVLIDESGSTFGKSMFEVAYVIDLLRSAAGDARHVFGETMPMSQPGQLSLTVRRPLGVIAGIAPFNAPFLLAMKKVALALAAGNTFILKPSEETPVSGLKIAEIFEAAKLPPGVLNVIPGPAAEVGAEEALKLANDTSYGLSSAVITNDLQKAFDLSMRLEAGMVHVNDCTVSDEPHVPFGGTKNSGVGREGGRYSMEEMTEIKWITVQMGQRQFPF